MGMHAREVEAEEHLQASSCLEQHCSYALGFSPVPKAHALMCGCSGKLSDAPWLFRIMHPEY